jgi:hypothetical protein
LLDAGGDIGGLTIWEDSKVEAVDEYLNTRYFLDFFELNFGLGHERNLGRFFVFTKVYILIDFIELCYYSVGSVNKVELHLLRCFTTMGFVVVCF